MSALSPLLFAGIFLFVLATILVFNKHNELNENKKPDELKLTIGNMITATLSTYKREISLFLLGIICFALSEHFGKAEKKIDKKFELYTSGIVVDGAKRPIENIQVDLIIDGKNIGSKITDVDGRFQFIEDSNRDINADLCYSKYRHHKSITLRPDPHRDDTLFLLEKNRTVDFQKVFVHSNIPSLDYLLTDKLNSLLKNNRQTSISVKFRYPNTALFIRDSSHSRYKFTTLEMESPCGQTRLEKCFLPPVDCYLNSVVSSVASQNVASVIREKLDYICLELKKCLKQNP